MSKLLALVFTEEASVFDQGALYAGRPASDIAPEPDIAKANLKTIENAAKEGGVVLEDAVIAFRSPQGDLKLKQTRDIGPGRGAGRGAFWGLLAGIVLGGPIAGVLFGLGIGAIYGRAVDHGIKEKFIKDVTEALRPGRSAILLLVDDKDYERSAAYLRSFEADFYEADVKDGAIEAIREAAENPDVQKAHQEQHADEDQ